MTYCLLFLCVDHVGLPGNNIEWISEFIFINGTEYRFEFLEEIEFWFDYSLLGLFWNSVIFMIECQVNYVIESILYLAKVF
jgi:hypothetical protein